MSTNCWHDGRPGRARQNAGRCTEVPRHSCTISGCSSTTSPLEPTMRFASRVRGALVFVMALRGRCRPGSAVLAPARPPVTPSSGSPTRSSPVQWRTPSASCGRSWRRIRARGDEGPGRSHSRSRLAGTDHAFARPASLQLALEQAVNHVSDSTACPVAVNGDLTRGDVWPPPPARTADQRSSTPRAGVPSGRCRVGVRGRSVRSGGRVPVGRGCCRIPPLRRSPAGAAPTTRRPKSPAVRRVERPPATGAVTQ
jgi:hypothetical protein